MYELEHCPDCGYKLYRHKLVCRREVIVLSPVPMAEPFMQYFNLLAQGP
jgi:hypothetical protein